jgi:hypothetical protein
MSEVLSAFIDGERVDPEELAEALAEPGARETLVDFVLLRQAVSQGGDPSPEFVGRVRRKLGAGASGWGRVLRLAAAAVLAVLAVLGALDLAGFGLSPQPGGEGPPEAARELRFEPGVDWLPDGGGRS